MAKLHFNLDNKIIEFLPDNQVKIIQTGNENRFIVVQYFSDTKVTDFMKYIDSLDFSKEVILWQIFLTETIRFSSKHILKIVLMKKQNWQIRKLRSCCDIAKVIVFIQDMTIKLPLWLTVIHMNYMSYILSLITL